MILTLAVLTTHVSVGTNSATPGLLAGFWGRDEKGRREGRGKGKERKVGGKKEEKRGEKTID